MEVLRSKNTLVISAFFGGFLTGYYFTKKKFLQKVIFFKKYLGSCGSDKSTEYGVEDIPSSCAERNCRSGKNLLSYQELIMGNELMTRIEKKDQREGSEKRFEEIRMNKEVGQPKEEKTGVPYFSDYQETEARHNVEKSEHIITESGNKITTRTNECYQQVEEKLVTKGTEEEDSLIKTKESKNDILGEAVKEAVRSTQSLRMNLLGDLKQVQDCNSSLNCPKEMWEQMNAKSLESRENVLRSGEEDKKVNGENIEEMDKSQLNDSRGKSLACESKKKRLKKQSHRAGASGKGTKRGQKRGQKRGEKVVAESSQV